MRCISVPIVKRGLRWRHYDQLPGQAPPLVNSESPRPGFGNALWSKRLVLPTKALPGPFSPESADLVAHHGVVGQHFLYR